MRKFKRFLYLFKKFFYNENWISATTELDKECSNSPEFHEYNFK